MLHNKHIPIRFLRVSTKHQALTPAVYISIVKLKVENSFLPCFQRMYERNQGFLIPDQGLFVCLFVYKRVFEIQIFSAGDFVK